MHDNTFYKLRPRHFTDDIFKCIIVDEYYWILIWLIYIRLGPIDNNPVFIQMLACRIFGTMPLSEQMMA